MVSRGVQGDVEEAEGLEGGGDLVEGSEGQGARKIFAGDLDAGQGVVVANADLHKPHGMSQILGLFDLGQALGRHWQTIGKA